MRKISKLWEAERLRSSELAVVSELVYIYIFVCVCVCVCVCVQEREKETPGSAELEFNLISTTPAELLHQPFDLTVRSERRARYRLVCRDGLLFSPDTCLLIWEKLNSSGLQQSP